MRGEFVPGFHRSGLGTPTDYYTAHGFPLLTITILLLYLHLPILSFTWDRPNRLLSLVTSPLIQKEGEKHGFV
jgi:hypothetical protein